MTNTRPKGEPVLVEGSRSFRVKKHTRRTKRRNVNGLLLLAPLLDRADVHIVLMFIILRATN